MSRYKIYPVMQAILAAALFGISTPLSKVLLGSTEPVALAAFLYLGSGVGLGLVQLVTHMMRKQVKSEASLSGKDIPWLIGAIVFGGILAPVISMMSLQRTPASTASLLLNFESVATMLIALLFFKENIGKRVGIAIGLVTLSCIVLSWDFSSRWGISLGAAGVIFACVCWGIDNNFTRNISSKNPFTIVAVKGMGAGAFSLCLALINGSRFPEMKIVLLAMLLGFFSYGLSIVLFVLAMRNLGSARTSAFFGSAPFIGTLLSFVIYKSVPDLMFIIAVPIMIFGTVLLLKDRHEHYHRHEPVIHEHQHTHSDGHHCHAHDEIHNCTDISHSHIHAHDSVEHTHQHMPDINHRHRHLHSHK